MIEGWGFNPPPHWPKPPEGWTPPVGWVPDPLWGPVPPGWQLWVPARRNERRRRVLPFAALVAVAAVTAGAATTARVPGPGPDDPRAGGTSLIAMQRPALLDSGAITEGTATGRPVPSSAAEPSSVLEPTGPPNPVATSAPASTPASTRTRAATVKPAPTVIRYFRTCARLNRLYPNGLGMPDAVDRTTGKPVVNFGRSSALYRANLKHDRDGDGIACEPRLARPSSP